MIAVIGTSDAPFHRSARSGYHAFNSVTFQCNVGAWCMPELVGFCSRDDLDLVP